MTVNQLITVLETLRDQGHGEKEVVAPTTRVPDPAYFEETKDPTKGKVYL